MDLKQIVLGAALIMGATTTAHADINPCKKTQQGLYCEQKIGRNTFIYYELKENPKSPPIECVSKTVEEYFLGQFTLIKELIDKGCDNQLDTYILSAFDNGNLASRTLTDLNNLKLPELIELIESGTLTKYFVIKDKAMNALKK